MDSWLGDSFLKYKYLLKEISPRKGVSTVVGCVFQSSQRERNDEYSESEELKGNIPFPYNYIEVQALSVDMHAVFFKP